MKIIVAPDKFKGSLSSFEICAAVIEGITNSNRNSKVLAFPMADGGDGFGKVMKHYLKTESVHCNTVDPLGRLITAIYEWDQQNSTAIIEMAVASGLYLLNDDEKNPWLTSTFGTGLMIKDAIKKGAKSIILGLGGSATNDAGTGILAALGFEFLDGSHRTVEPCGGTLGEMKRIQMPADIPAIKFQIACDVTNVLYGKQGAAYVYGPQKGADAQQVAALDRGLKNFSHVLLQLKGGDVSNIPGTGAAGGIAAGLIPFFEVEMKSGIEMIVDVSGIENELRHAQLLITGEGRIDLQSGEGKVVGYMASLADRNKIPCFAICGEMKLDQAGLKNLRLQKTLALTSSSITKEEAIANARSLIVEKIGELVTGL